MLITGFCAVHVGSKRRRVQRWYQGDCLERLATLCGYEVDRRAVNPEAPGKWDVAFVALGIPNVIGAPYAGGALSILGRPGVIPHFDLWDVQRTMKSILSLRQAGRGKALAKVPGMRYAGWLERRGDAVEGAVEKMAVGGIKTALVPLFPWGDHKRLHALLPLVDKMAWLDFSAVEPFYLGEGYEPKWGGREREWVWALHNGWLPSNTPPRTSWGWRLVGKAADEKAPLIDEDRVVQMYADSWGVRVTPQSDRRGDGWFKNTYAHAARAGSILWLDEDDAKRTGYDIVAERGGRRNLEGADDADLAAMAQYQREWYFDHSWSLSTLKDKFRRLCERTVDHG